MKIKTCNNDAKFRECESKRDEEEKLENKRKRRIVRPCLPRPRGRKKRKRIPPRSLLRRKIILQQKVILK